VVFDKKVSNDGVCHHDSVVRNVASLVNYHRGLKELRNDPEFSGRAFLSKEASISQLMNVSNKSVFHFLENKKKSRKILFDKDI
jgi:hypothetical protein